MIETSDLTYSYGETRALSGVSVTINSGEWTIIAGRNGSGKTTLVHHFNALLTPDSGSIQVNGQSPATDPVTARTRVGMVFQNPRDQFVAATVGSDVAFGPENLGLDRSAIDDRVARALAAVNMDGRQDARLDELSGGEQARIAIAGALAMEPAYLVLDEPFAGLDWPAIRTLLDHLDALHDAGTGIIVVTHDVRDVLKRATHLIGLEGGEVAVTGDPSDVRDRLEPIGVRPPEW